MAQISSYPGFILKAAEIGLAMLEIMTRGSSIPSGNEVNTSNIIRYSNAYDQR